jgi:hypothetical protein
MLFDSLDLSVKVVSLDRGFDNSPCLGLLSAHNSTYAMPIVKWGETIQTKLNRGWSRDAPPRVRRIVPAVRRNR